MTQTRWEYMLLKQGDKSPEELVVELNELGGLGWELVAYVGYQQLDSVVLKRPLDADQPESGYANLVD